MARTESLGDKIKNLLPTKQRQEQGYEPPQPSLPSYTELADDGMYEDDNEDPSFPKNMEQQRDVIDPSLMQQPAYEENQIQLMSDIAADESLPVLTYYISNLSHLGHKAQARLIARSSAFQSKNQVFSNIIDLRDYQMAQDDFEYAKILSVSDFTSFDMTTDYFTAEAIMEAQFNIRIRRARKALNLLQLNTQRNESGPTGGYHQQQEKAGVLQKLSLLGSGGSGGRF